MNQTAGSGTPPSVGRLARSQPQISPAINTPPLTVRLSGTLPIRVTNAHPKISPPRKIPIPTSVMLLFSVGASLNPISSAARSTSCRSPTSSIRSPASSLPPPSTGICTFARRIERIDTPCMYFSFSRARTVLPATPFLLTTTGSVSTEKLTSSLSSTSRPIHVSSSMTNRRRPLTTISSPRRMTGFRGGILDRSLLSEALDENPLLLPGHVLLELAYRPPRLEPLVVGAEGAENDRTRRRVESRTEAHVVPHLRFHLLGRLLYFRDAAEQPRAEGAEYPGRSGHAVDVGDRVADRHHAQVRVASAGQLVNRIRWRLR